MITVQELANEGAKRYGSLNNKTEKCTQCGKEVSQVYKGGMCSDCESEFERTHPENSVRNSELKNDEGICTECGKRGYVSTYTDKEGHEFDLCEEHYRKAKSGKS